MRSYLGPFSTLFVAASIAVFPAAGADEMPSVEQSLASFRLADPDLWIEPAAVEPNVVDPVSITWDEHGAMYAVEMRDYPDGASGGTVRRLVDSDGDGVYETATAFASGLSFPTSAIPWSGGLIVASAPNLIYLKDTDGDGIADERRTLFTGFGTGLPQQQVNSLYWGVDLWVYGSNGGSDGSVSSPGGSPVTIARRDFRFRPSAGLIEAVPGFSQNGGCQTEFGARLVSRATSPVRQVVLNQITADPAAEDASILEWFDSGRIWPISAAQTRFSSEPLEFFNSACGLSTYTGTALAVYEGNVFVCEPASNLVHRRVLAPNGSILKAKRGESGLDFLASTDPWFRPVGVSTGPDGALYIVDFCRRVIEHPSIAPEDARGTVDWTSGGTLGRIWRVRPKSWGATQDNAPNLSRATSEQLVHHIDSANGWARNQSQRLLVERAATDAVESLAKIATESERVTSRIAALFTLEAMGRADEPVISAALTDTDARVRSVAVTVAQSRFADFPKLIEMVAGLAQDKDPAVRRHVANATKFMPAEMRLETCRTLTSHADGDRWVALAILQNAGDHAWPLLQSVFATRTWNLDWWAARNFDLASQLAQNVGASGNANDVATLLTQVTTVNPITGWPDMALLSGLGNGLSQSGQTLRQAIAQPGADSNVATGLNRAFGIADQLAHHKGADISLRRAAVRLLLEQPDGSGMEKLLAMLKPDETPEIVDAIVSTLGQAGGSDTNLALLERWSGLSKDVRGKLVGEFVSAPAQTSMLLDAIEQGTVLKHEIALPIRNTLLNSADAAIRDRASSLYPPFSSPAKADLHATYAPALQMPADAARGARQFAINCFPCHQMNGIGNTVGPELATTSGKTKEELMHSILDPSAQVLPDFISYTISTKNFEDYAGLLVKEDAASVTLRAAGGMEQTVLRSDIETITPGSMSLMPDGLEAAFDVQALADLIEFIQRPDMEALKQALAETAPPAP